MNQQTGTFNWLHLTDIHWKFDGQDILWPNVKEKFYESLTDNHHRCGPWNAVLFTGDLVQDGSPEQFVQLQERVLEPLFAHIETLQGTRPFFLAVPGNHDLNRPNAKSPSAALRFLLSSELFNIYAGDLFSGNGAEYLKELEKAFEGYTRWWENVLEVAGKKVNKGILPGDFSATVPVCGGYNIGIVGLNTAFLQLQSGKFEGKLAWHLAQLHKVCHGDPPEWIKKHDLCILMTHHGPDWLNPSAGGSYSEIYPAGRFAAHLFGHMHKPSATAITSGGGGVRRLWQGRSLFGMEKYGEPPHYNRQHGYSAGRIKFQDGQAEIRQWPLIGVGWEKKDPNGFRLVPDNIDFVLVDDNGTEPETIRLASGRRQTPSADQAKNMTALESRPTNQLAPEVFLVHTTRDKRFVSLLAEELRCFGWKSVPYVLKGKPTKSDPLWKNKFSGRAFCFIISPGFDSNSICVSTVEQVRRQYPEARRFFVLVDVSESICVKSEDLILTEEGLGGVRRREIIRIAGDIDKLGRDLPCPADPIKERREISFSPNPFTELMSQDDLRITRHHVVRNLFNMLRSNRVVAISGVPSSGRSTLAIDLMTNLSTCEPNRANWPFIVIGTSVCDGSIPDLPRLCSIVFNALGPPPATAEDDPAVALACLLDECETWLVLDQFETAMTIEKRCKDSNLARFLTIANNTLERGRVIVTTSSAGVDLGDGQSCVNFSVPEWAPFELKQLATHIAKTMNVNPPTARHFLKLQELASGNPYLMVVAMRKWCATCLVPEELNANLAPYEKLGLFVQAAGFTGRAILHVLDLVTTFSAGLSLIRKTLKRLHRQSLDLDLPADIDVDAEIANLRGMELLQVQRDRYGEPCYRLPGMVSDCLRKQFPLKPVLRHVVGKVLANCILEETDHIANCLELVGPAIYDGQRWLWTSVSKEEVGRAVRAADVLISAGDVSYAANLLMGEKNEILKCFNRIAPASIRSNFFSRFRIATKKDPISCHEATRGLALAQADMADFDSAVNLLHDAMEILDDASGQIEPDDLNHYKAKDLDLKAYCLRQLCQLDYSIHTYHEALGLVTPSGYEDERCKLLRGLGNSLLVQGNYPQAKMSFNESENVAKQLSPRRQFFNEGRINCDRTILEIRTGDLEAAKKICIKGMNAMHECRDIWNERIAFMNLCGIELSLSGDIESASSRLRTLTDEFLHLENFLALRVARKHAEALRSAPETVNVSWKWTFIELT